CALSRFSYMGPTAIPRAIEIKVSMAAVRSFTSWGLCFWMNWSSPSAAPCISGYDLLEHLHRHALHVATERGHRIVEGLAIPDRTSCFRFCRMADGDDNIPTFLQRCDCPHRIRWPYEICAKSISYITRG